MNDQVVLVHGLWVRALVMARLANRLRTAGFDTHLFNYKTRSGALPAQAEQLHRFISKRSLTTLHLLAHSLGGLVAMEMLARYRDLPPGRVVLLGSPVNGSELVRRLTRGATGKLFFGNSGEALAGGCNHQSGGRQTGLIAGNRPYGLGRLVRIFDLPNDGTVAVAETRLNGPASHIELPVTHTGMLFSAAVAEQVICFLKSGAFKPL